MARGIELPTRAKNGRLRLLAGDEYIRQLVITAMQPGDSENPFQDLGIGEDMIFEINDDLLEGEIRARAERVFTILDRDQLARLESLRFERENGDLTMFVDYVDLETGERIQGVPVPITT